MIKEIEVAELVAYLAKRSKQESYSCSFIKLRQIGNYLETSDQAIRVELGERSIRAFRSRSVRHIVIKGTMIEVNGISSPIMQSIIRQYTPSPHVVGLIENALKTVK